MQPLIKTVTNQGVEHQIELSLEPYVCQISRPAEGENAGLTERLVFEDFTPRGRQGVIDSTYTWQLINPTTGAILQQDPRSFVSFPGEFMAFACMATGETPIFLIAYASNLNGMAFNEWGARFFDQETLQVRQPVNFTLAEVVPATEAGNDGQVLVNVVDGIAPFQYKANGGAFLPTAALTGLPAGPCIITVKDAAGTEKTQEVNL